LLRIAGQSLLKLEGKDMVSQETVANCLGDWAYQAIADYCERVFQREAGVLADQDPEALHQMRIGLRRLRSAVLGFAPALDLNGITAADIGKYGRILGKLRDIDVMLLKLKQLRGMALPESERQQLKQLRQLLQGQRRQQVKKVHRFLQSQTYQTFKARCHHWLTAPTYRAIATVELSLVLPDLLLPQLSELLLHPGWWIGAMEADLGNPDHLSKQDWHCLHDLRKAAKRSRYNRELFLPLYGEDYQQQLKQIKRVQTLIGEFQDGEVLTDFLWESLRENLKQNPKKTLPVLMQQLTQERQQTWVTWQQIRTQFLDPDYRQNLRQTLSQSIVSHHVS
jgi:CHAD domain-containing protein